ncbi:16S rRNA processing protein RimM [Lyngbya aestuarii BL J]|uniref:Ribosome maturation factor RimM n=1 Tax=Lyngbya aestuarii BL J TaxID=1348334 RepID=U7QR24_9CYAN|nr:ribosome maturation factor RimM [Lyngbya aestuarii]ERT09560.1 16S rRNA processing protein RimM [Lyngbya aestuarii BL J]
MSEWIEIGKIVAAQGLDGEVRVNPNSDFPERFLEPGTRWLLQPGQSEPQPIELLEGRQIPGRSLYVLELEGIENREQAEALRNSTLFVSKNDRPYLEENEFYLLDLIGLEVFNQLTQEVIGVVISLVPAGNDLLEVELYSSTLEPSEIPLDSDQPSAEVSPPRRKKRKSKPKTVLIPFVEEIVPVVDLNKNRVEITPPVGLIE